MADELPFKTEYAKSGRASCKGCKLTISKDSLRLAKMVQSQHFDGKQPMWFHYGCFFKKNKPKQIGEIEGIGNLRWEDQEKIKSNFGASDSAPSASAASSKADEIDGSLADYQVEYAKSSRSTCKVCDNKIQKGEVRVAIMVDGDSKYTSGKIPSWHHLDCFTEKKKSEPELANISENDLAGFKALKDEDKTLVKKVLGLKKTKKKSSEKSAGQVAIPDPDEIALKEQSQLLWKLHDDLKKNCSTSLLRIMLEENHTSSKGGENDLLERCADGIAFGVPGSCPECHHGKLLYSSCGYHCIGHVTAWTKCLYKTFKPPRKKWIITANCKDECEFLKTIKPTVKNRIFPKSMNAMDPDKPLGGKKVLLSTAAKKSKKGVAEKIEELGGMVVKDIASDLLCFIATKAEVTKGSKKITQLMDLCVPIVFEGFVFEVKKGNLEECIRSHEIVPTKQKLDSVDGPKKRKKANANASTQSPKKQKLLLKGGAVVDPDSGLEDSCHVHEKNGEIYSAVLGMVDLARGTNSYYKVQVLVHDHAKQYYVYRSWGRVGTTIGGNKLEGFDILEEAIENFVELFEEKTGNSWYRRKDFVKHPYKFYPIEVDFGNEGDSFKQLEAGKDSKLPMEVQKLITMIFDVNLMKKTMAEFEIDMNKMPLGKLSKSQIEKAYQVLGELQQCLDNNETGTKILDASNRFYTLIPHDFGLKAPPLLNKSEMIKEKTDMLDSLMDIEIAYNLLKTSSKDKDPIDAHYDSLKADIKVVDKKSEEFAMLEVYVQNTHASTHRHYSLKLEEAFEVDRQGEKARYSPFRELHNRKLLWHGSRLSNYAGIISQGLRIAPPEAPVTGYMFGKGIYFADMVSKSANYCHTSYSNPTGLMLLCEVALGNMYELLHAKGITKLPKGKHSCKGMGRTAPDPGKDRVLQDGVVVPLGKGVDQNAQGGSLLYNEYIVYDIAQVQMKYLLKLNFDYQHR
ncbi:poly [ADP-ribose] polymerase 1-like [Rhopilema esculentum]|uniref:poly [ADP-ribose] polymerase 1-like n=1 Tax=Rhopilema esculentum TaxID=499914 RepID=UPI0031DC0D08